MTMTMAIATTTETMPILWNQYATNKERWIFKELADMSKVLGIPVPNVGLAYSKRQAREMSDSQRYTGWNACTMIDSKHYYKVVIMLRKRRTKKA